MTIKIEDFTEFVQEKFALLSPTERVAIENFLTELESESTIDAEALTSKLSRFLCDHGTIDAQVEEFIEDPTRAPGRVKITPQEFSGILRNAVLASESPSQPASESPSQPNEPVKPTN